MENCIVNDGNIIGNVTDYLVNGKNYPRLCQVTVTINGSQHRPLETACDRNFAKNHLTRLMEIAKTIRDSMDADQAA